MIYLDNSATTHIKKEVFDVINTSMSEDFGNPSAMYSHGIEAEKKIKKAKKIIAKTINCNEKDIIFTSSGSESNNFAIKGIADRHKRRGKHIITSAIEHPSVANPMQYLAENGFDVTVLPVDNNGMIDIDQLRQAISSDTILVSIMMVNNEVGSIQDIKNIAKVIKSENPSTILHVDAVQAYGKLPIDVKKLHIDLMSISGHKIGAPKGIGVLYKNDKIHITPLIHGGGQERNLRSGTENTHYILGMAKACEIAMADMEKNREYVSALRNKLTKEITSRLPNVILNSRESGLEYILNISLPPAKSEVLLHILEQNDIYASAGSACHSKNKTKSETLYAMGFPHQVIESALRFSFSPDNKIEDMSKVASVLEDAYNTVSSMVGGR